jgi:hypothetical protein
MLALKLINMVMAFPIIPIHSIGRECIDAPEAKQTGGFSTIPIHSIGREIKKKYSIPRTFATTT